MIIALLLALAPYIDIHASLQLPIPLCTPELVGIDGRTPLTYPESRPLVFTFADTPVRLIVQSTCREPRWICVDWRVVCDSDCIFAAGGRTSAKNEVGEDAILFIVPMRCWSQTEQVVCRVEYEPSALGDLDGDCGSTPADVKLLAGMQNRNRLEIFRFIQNELPESAGSNDWDWEWSGSPNP